MYVYPQYYIEHSSITRSLFIRLETQKLSASIVYLASYYWLLLLLLFCCYPVTKFLDCNEFRRGQYRYSILGSLTFALLGHIYIRITRAVFHSSGYVLP